MLLMVRPVCVRVSAWANGLPGLLTDIVPDAGSVKSEAVRSRRCSAAMNVRAVSAEPMATEDSGMGVSGVEQVSWLASASVSTKVMLTARVSG